MPESNNSKNKSQCREYNALEVGTFILGLFGLCVVIGYTSVTAWLAYLTSQSVAISQKQFEMSQRPWVYIKVILPNDDLTHDKRGARYSFRFILSNVGHSPAAGTWIYIDPYFTGMGKQIDYLIAQRATCDPLRKRKRNPHTLGTTLFPGQEKPFIQDVFVKPKNSADIFDGAFVGCIDYGFEFAEGHHQTPIIFHVEKSGYLGALAIMPNENVPVSDLLIDEWIEAGSNAD